MQTALAHRPVRFVANSRYAQGLSTSIKAGLAAVSSRTRAVLLALGDMPLVEATDLDFLITRFTRAQHATIAVPVFNGRRGNPVLFDICHRSAMLELAGDVGCKMIVERCAHQVLEIEMPNDHVLCDVDTFEAYERLCTKFNMQSRQATIISSPEKTLWKPKRSKRASTART